MNDTKTICASKQIFTCIKMVNDTRIKTDKKDSLPIKRNESIKCFASVCHLFEL
jgi:hypothetical protein